MLYQILVLNYEDSCKFLEDTVLLNTIGLFVKSKRRINFEIEWGLYFPILSTIFSILSVSLL